MTLQYPFHRDDTTIIDPDFKSPNWHGVLIWIDSISLCNILFIMITLRRIWSPPLSLVIFEQSNLPLTTLWYFKLPAQMGRVTTYQKPFQMPFQTAVPWPFLCLSSHPLPSWHHLHQTPSLRPFRADVVLRQIQDVQGGVLFQCRGQSLAGDTPFEKHDDEDSTHTHTHLYKN